MAMMQKQLENMPPAQRAQIEAMMKGRGMPGAGAAPRMEYRRAGADRVGEWACVTYEGFLGGPAEQRPSGWASVLKQGIDFLKDRLQARDDAKARLERARERSRQQIAAIDPELNELLASDFRADLEHCETVVDPADVPVLRR